MCIKELFSHLFKNSDSTGINVSVNSQKGDIKKKKTINKISSEGAFNNSGTINSGTINNFYLKNPALDENMEKENNNDEQLYFSYYNSLNLDGMKSFLDMMLSGGIWNARDNERIFDFLDHVTKDSDNFFFDEGLEIRRIAFVDACKSFYREIINQSGTYRGTLTYSLRDDDNDYQRLTERQRIMTPLSKSMFDSYHDLVWYARKEKKFL